MKQDAPDKIQNKAPDNTQLRFLLRLVDDSSPVVRAKIAPRLRAWGPAVWHEIHRQNLDLTVAQAAALHEILMPEIEDQQKQVPQEQAPQAQTLNEPDKEAFHKEAFRQRWLSWLHLEDEKDERGKLEAAYALLTQWQSGPAGAARLHAALDDLAQEFLHSGHIIHPEELSFFLFQKKGLSGAAAEDYYNPLNTDLLYVLETGRGIPISLSSIFILVGHRLGLEVYGCNFPGHFLARAVPDGFHNLGAGELVFDCFNGGRALSEVEVAALRKAAPQEMSTPASTAVIIARVLRNLANAYYQVGEAEHTRFVLNLLADLESSQIQ